MTAEPLGLGERAPDFVAAAADGIPTRFYARAGGRPAVVAFPGAADLERVAALTDALPPSIDRFVLAPPDAPDASGAGVAMVDVDGRIAEAWRTKGMATAYALDANLRVLGSAALVDPAACAERLTGFVRALPERPAREVRSQAPVLFVPHALDPEWCARLRQAFQDGDTAPSGVEQTVAGRRMDELQDKLKRRRDLVVTDQALSGALAPALGRRVMPELRRAFAYQATRFEGFKIGCYEADDGGFFNAHRDNLSAPTAHRRFAMTLNLNDDYEGGTLRFPEFGPETYRPDAGAALLFSCSHLHEVLPVTRGRRFVLLSFLFGEADAARLRGESGGS
jgi:predicted 2-oxoglutarate/Fe(II)-dependent dioxygenase YbiX